MLYRMTNRGRSEVAEWEKAFLEDYETATKGSSALSAALQRNLVQEVCHFLGFDYATILNDFDLFLTPFLYRS